jgi:hypothetical protein
MAEPAKLAIRRDFQRPSAAQVKALARGWRPSSPTLAAYSPAESWKIA